MLARVTGTRSSSRGPTPGFPDDDLPGFLSCPPGTPRPAPAGGPARPGPRSRPPPPVGGGAPSRRTAATVLVVGAVVAPRCCSARGTPRPGPRARGGPGDVRAHLAAAGVVLAQAPAGVTAGFPTVSLTTHGDRAALHLDLLLANCLTPTAPARPEDAGCQPVAHESGDLASPALRDDLRRLPAGAHRARPAPRCARTGRRRSRPDGPSTSR